MRSMNSLERLQTDYVDILIAYIDQMPYVILKKLAEAFDELYESWKSAIFWCL